MAKVLHTCSGCVPIDASIIDTYIALTDMVNYKKGDPGKSAYQIAVENGFDGTEEEWLASLEGPVGETPDISIGEVTTGAAGSQASASMGGTAEEPVLNLTIPRGDVGATPNISIGTVTTGAAGTGASASITGTPAAPVLNLTIPRGPQGNTGSSVAYPYELVNNRTTDDATKGASAAALKDASDELIQLEKDVSPVVSAYTADESVDVSSLTLRNYSIKTDGNYGNDSSYKHVRINVIPGTKVKVVANSENMTRVCFVKSTTAPSASGAIDLCSGTLVTEISAANTACFVAPSDAVQVFVYRGKETQYVSTPESVVVSRAIVPADNLDTESASAPLSANQGVVLAGYSSDTRKYVYDDMTKSSSNYTDGDINSSGNWTGTGKYRHYQFSVNPGDTVEIKANSSYQAKYAFLTEGTSSPVNGESANLVADTSTVTISAGQSATVVAPDTAKVLFIYSGDSSTNTSSWGYNRPEYIRVVTKSITVAENAALRIVDIEKKNVGRDEYSYFVGAGTTLSYAKDTFYGVVAGETYTIEILNPNVALADTSGSNYRLSVHIKDSSGTTIAAPVQVSTGARLRRSYSFQIPEGGERVLVGGRCVAGAMFPFLIRHENPSAFASGRITNVNPECEFGNKFRSAVKRYYTSTYTTAPNNVVFLHLSDIHGNWPNVERFIDFADYWKTFINGGLINTGDTVVNKLTDGTTGYAALNGVEKIMTVIGNHDTRGNNGWQDYIGLPAYNALIGPYVSNWGVTQPEGAAENGYCYYYKDYADSNLRLVCVDIMSFDSTQNEWLAGALASAKEAGYHVLIATHFAGASAPGHGDDPAFEKFNCNYSTKYSMGGSSDGLNGYNANAYLMMGTVHAFQQAGGIFVGYLQGHYHADFCAKAYGYDDQLIFSIGSSKDGEMRDYNHVVGTRMQDEFQIVSVDTYGKLVKLFKVGACVDRYGRHKNSICFSYNTHEIVAEGY